MPKLPRRPYATIQAFLDGTGTKQYELAAKVGIQKAHMSNVLRKKRNCSLALAKRLSKITNVPIEAIGGIEPESENPGTV